MRSKLLIDGTKVRDIRTRRALTQAELAESSGKISKRAVEVIEQNGKLGKCARVTERTLEALSVALAVPQAELLAEDMPQSFRTFLLNVANEFGVIRFLGAPSYNEEIRRYVAIGSLYIEPALSPRPMRPESNNEDLRGLSPALDVVRKHKKLVLLGDPGTGKSTLISWIAWQFAVDALSDGRQTSWPDALGRNILGAVLPIPFILRDLAIDDTITWDKLLEKFLFRSLGQPLRHLPLKTIFKSGRAFFLVDGLDEVGGVNARQKLKDAIHDGMKRYPNCRWLMTSRIVGYSDVPFDSRIDRKALFVGANIQETNVTIAHLHYMAPFDDARVDGFARQWHTLQREASQVHIDLGVRELVKAIRRDRGTQSLGRIPYLITLMALIHRVDATLPDGRALLYNKITEAFMQQLDDFKGVTERRENLPTKKRWLARVGFEMQRRRTEKEEPEEGIVATKEDVCGWLADAMKAGKSEAEVFLDFLIRRTGLLLPRGVDQRGVNQFGFIHLSFQEYFAACHLKQQIVSPTWEKSGARNAFSSYANATLWHETLVLLVELIANGDEADWLDPVLETLFGPDLNKIDSQGEKVQNQVVLLARLATDHHAGLSPDFRKKAIDLCCEWEVEVQKRLDNIWNHEPPVVAALLEGTENPQDAFLVLVDKMRREKLTRVSLRNTFLEDLEPLKCLEHLEELNLFGTSATSLEPLTKLVKLKRLDVNKTKVSRGEINRFQQILRGCSEVDSDVEHDQCSLESATERGMEKADAAI